MPDVGTVPQVSVYVTGAAETFTVPHEAVLPLQVPELADTLTATVVPVLVGVRFAGVHTRPEVTSSVSLHFTVGTGVIGVPTVPVVALIVQVNVALLLDELFMLIEPVHFISPSFEVESP
jgi:hypothetical protein